MCVSEGFGGFHDSQPSIFKDIASAPLCFHNAINLYIQNPELAKNQSFRLSRQSGRHSSCNPAVFALSDVTETASKRR